MKNFIKKFIAVSQEESVEELAQNTFAQVKTALDAQIAIIKGEVIDAEDDVRNKFLDFESTRVNWGKKITSRNDYLSKLISSKNQLTQSEERLQTVKEKLAFLESELNLLLEKK